MEMRFVGPVVEWAISEFPCASVSKRVLVRNLSNENDFDLHENETARGSHFDMKGFALRLALKQQRELRNGLLRCPPTMKLPARNDLLSSVNVTLSLIF